ncbi:hypothetical protein N7510_004360 [Penicillium lagena]|uniref:uncharacterized protein n=1 Tax=Penicillium lagena TaxID=94218 RepID=UPI002541715E|nr:uncharacterized protein N7510_004360 [Penicillium lagena]KAJ5620376.1 hypothetical protein N7510_004360 [Penicillium lagena]
MHCLLLSCPNLKSFSVGKLFQDPPIPEPASCDVEWASGDMLPPIQSLSINGGQIGGPNWARWEDTICWPSLSSVSIGPLSMHACAALNRLNGQARFLQSFTYLCACSHSQARLSQFLASFNTLKSLEVTKTFCFVKDVALHTQLTNLSLHVNEWSRFRQDKATLSCEDLEYLDAQCPNLQKLALDINPDNEEWVRQNNPAIYERNGFFTN